jgi:hypothetical protein
MQRCAYSPVGLSSFPTQGQNRAARHGELIAPKKVRGNKNYTGLAQGSERRGLRSFAPGIVVPLPWVRGFTSLPGFKGGTGAVRNNAESHINVLGRSIWLRSAAGVRGSNWRPQIFPATAGLSTRIFFRPRNDFDSKGARTSIKPPTF